MINSNLLCKKEVARILKVSVSTVYRWTVMGHLIPPFRLGENRVMWNEVDLNEWIEKQKSNKGFLERKPTQKSDVNKAQ